MKRKTIGILLSLPIAAGLLIADALEPGQGAFYNPMFWARSQWAKRDTNWRERPLIDAADARLAPCTQFTGETELTEAQEGLRDALIGKSETLTLQQLGPPTCALSETVYRWITESGLALDVEIEDSEVQDAELTR
jgi:hypothetical protein